MDDVYIIIMIILIACTVCAIALFFDYNYRIKCLKTLQESSPYSVFSISCQAVKVEPLFP
jgi:hypothetical protein